MSDTDDDTYDTYTTSGDVYGSVYTPIGATVDADLSASSEDEEDDLEELDESPVVTAARAGPSSAGVKNRKRGYKLVKVKPRPFMLLSMSSGVVTPPSTPPLSPATSLSSLASPMGSRSRPGTPRGLRSRGSGKVVQGGGASPSAGQRPKSAGMQGRKVVVSCDNCEEAAATVLCATCGNRKLCASCDRGFHARGKRKEHVRVPLRSALQRLSRGSLTSDDEAKLKRALGGKDKRKSGTSSESRFPAIPGATVSTGGTASLKRNKAKLAVSGSRRSLSRSPSRSSTRSLGTPKQSHRRALSASTPNSLDVRPSSPATHSRSLSSSPTPGHRRAASKLTHGIDYWLLRRISQVLVHPMYDRTWWPLARDIAQHFTEAEEIISQHLLQEIHGEDIEDVEMVSRGHFGNVFTGYDRITKQRRFIKEQPLDGQFAIEIATTLVSAPRDLPSPALIGLVSAPIDPKTGKAPVGPGGKPCVWTVFDVSLGLPVDKFVEANGLHSVDLPMLFLTSAIAVWRLHKAHIIHNDIAARNFMVADMSQVQIIDFGLSVVAKSTRLAVEGVPYPHKPIPLRQVPAEFVEAFGTMGEPYCSLATDVHAFGLYMWEVLTGEQPMAELSRVGRDPATLVKALRTIRPKRPASKHCSDELWALMQRCWAVDPSKRPPMSHVVKALIGMSERTRAWANVVPILDKPNVALMKAASLGDLSIMRYFIDCCNADPSHVADRTLNTPLHAAAKSLNLDCVKYLVEQRYAKLNAVNVQKNTPLLEMISLPFAKLKAASQATAALRMAKYLILGCCVRLKPKNKKGKTVVDLAVENGWPKEVQRMTRGLISVEDPAVREEVDVIIAGSSARSGAATHPTLQEDASEIELRDEYAHLKTLERSHLGTPGEVALFTACQDGSARRARYAVDKLHANPFAANLVGRLPLHYAVEGRHWEVVLYLLSFMKRIKIDMADSSLSFLFDMLLPADGHLKSSSWVLAAGKSAVADADAVAHGVVSVSVSGGLMDQVSCQTLQQLSHAHVELKVVEMIKPALFIASVFMDSAGKRLKVQQWDERVLLEPDAKDIVLDGKVIGAGLRGNTAIETLDLSMYKIRNVWALGKAMRKQTSLQKLALPPRCAQVVALFMDDPARSRSLLGLQRPDWVSVPGEDGVVVNKCLDQLVRCKTVTSLNIAGVQGVDGSSLANALHASAALTALDVSKCAFVQGTVGDWLSALDSSANESMHLQTLKMAGVALSEAEADQLCEVLGKNKSIAALVASGVAHGERLHRVLRGNATLVSLDLSEMAKPVDGKDLGESVKKNVNVLQLSLRRTVVRNYAAFVAAVKDNTWSRLRTFSVYVPERAALEELAECLADPVVTGLDVTVGDESMSLAPLTEAMRSKERVSELRFEKGKVDLEAVAEIVVGTNLRMLRLDSVVSANGAAGWAALLDTLAANPTLARLEITKCAVRVLQPLEKALRKNKHLQRLELSSCSVTDVSALAKGLAKNAALQELDLSNNRVTQVNELVSALGKHKALRWFSLFNNRLSPEAKRRMDKLARGGKAWSQFLY